MMTHRLEQQLPIDTVEVTFDVDVEHPVVAPAALTSLAYSVDRRSAGPIAIRVGVEHRLQIRLQVAPGDLLGDTVGDRRNAQRARATVCLRNIDPPYRRRKIAPRRQPVPELVEVVRKINLEVCNRLCVYPSRSLVGLHMFEGFPDLEQARLPTWRLWVRDTAIEKRIFSRPEVSHGAQESLGDRNAGIAMSRMLIKRQRRLGSGKT